jgi:hypothetical protein
VTHLGQLSDWLEQYYSTRFETSFKEVREFAGNSKHDIPLTFKEKRTTGGKRTFDCENGDEPKASEKKRKFQNGIF